MRTRLLVVLLILPIAIEVTSYALDRFRRETIPQISEDPIPGFMEVKGAPDGVVVTTTGWIDEKFLCHDGGTRLKLTGRVTVMNGQGRLIEPIEKIEAEELKVRL